MANLRENHLRYATTALAQGHDAIGAETLAVKTMMRKGGAGKRRLNPGLGDAALATVIRQLAYKTTSYWATLIQAERAFPSSRTCTGCGAVKTTLPLTQRTYTCSDCGLSSDRDLNAAVNLAGHAANAASATGIGAAAAPLQRPTPAPHQPRPLPVAA